MDQRQEWSLLLRILDSVLMLLDTTTVDVDVTDIPVVVVKMSFWSCRGDRTAGPSGAECYIYFSRGKKRLGVVLPNWTMIDFSNIKLILFPSSMHQPLDTYHTPSLVGYMCRHFFMLHSGTEIRLSRLKLILNASTPSQGKLLAETGHHNWHIYHCANLGQPHLGPLRRCATATIIPDEPIGRQL